MLGFARIAAMTLGVFALMAVAPSSAWAREEIKAGGSAIVVGTEGRGLRVRRGPGMSHRIVATVAEGSVVQILAGPVSDGDDDWFQISASGATNGWAPSQYLTDNNTASGNGGGGPRSFIARMTAYADGVGGVPKNARTASGTPTRWGVVAVDPKMIPIGSTLTIDGYEGVFVAEDTGGGIKGPALDLWLADPSEAKRYGTQYRRVTVIREGPAR